MYIVALCYSTVLVIVSLMCLYHVWRHRELLRFKNGLFVFTVMFVAVTVLIVISDIHIIGNL
jgi:hypothetical protein